MRDLIFIIIVFVLVGFVWLLSGFWRFRPDSYLSEKVLEMSRPFDVKIDIEFLKRLEPDND